MVMKVYGPIKAACPQRVLACLVEKGVEFEVVHVDLDSGEHKRPDFLLRQPFGQVPVIEDGDFRLFGDFVKKNHLLFFNLLQNVIKGVEEAFIGTIPKESRAIIRYIAARYEEQGPNLLGKSLEEKAVVDQWLEVESHNFNELVYTLVLQLVILPRMGERGDLALAHACEQKLEKVFDVYEQRLSKSRYLAGESFTLADLSHLPGIRYLVKEAGMGHLVTERKRVNAWWEDISNRSAWKKVMELAS